MKPLVYAMVIPATAGNAVHATGTREKMQSGSNALAASAQKLRWATHSASAVEPPVRHHPGLASPPQDEHHPQCCGAVVPSSRVTSTDALRQSSQEYPKHGSLSAMVWLRERVEGAAWSFGSPHWKRQCASWLDMTSLVGGPRRSESPLSTWSTKPAIAP